MKSSIFPALCRLMIIVLLAGLSLDVSAQGGYGMGDAIPIPVNSCATSNFYDYQNNGYFNDTYGQGSGDVWYSFTLPVGTYVNISLCSSDFDTYVSVVDVYYNLYASNDDDWSSCGGTTSAIDGYFPAGTYYIVAEGSGYTTGNLALAVTIQGSGSPSAGANMGNAINAGTFGSSGSYTDTKSNTDDCLGNDIGQVSNDIYYSFTLTSTATVTLSHCGTGFDTYMHLLDAYGSVISSNDDGYQASPCLGTESYIQTTLSAGTYYVVSEGYSTNAGNIVTNISVSGGSGGSVPVISYSTPSSFAVGAAISPLSPTNTGGAVSASGQTTSTFVSSGLSNPISTAVDAAGNVYVADAGNHSIRKVSPSGVMSTLAGAGYAGYADGTGTSAVFRHPTFLVVDASGNVFVSDQQNHRVRKITPSGVVSTFAGSGSIGSGDGTGTSASFQYPMGLAFDVAGNLFVADGYNHKIRKISPSGVVTTFAGTGGIGMANGPALSATFNYPMGLAFDAAGNLMVADRMNHMIRKITSAGTVSTFSGNGFAGFNNSSSSFSSFNETNGVTVDVAGNVFVADRQNHMVRKLDPSGAATTLAGTGAAASVDGTGASVSFNSPYGVTINPQGAIYVAENAANKIRKIVIAKAYAISPALPAGLVFNEDTGTISGTPTGASPATIYTVTAYNSSGSGNTTLSIEISGSCPVPSYDQNYVISYTPREAGLTTPSAVVSASCNPFRVQTGIQYFDGLGRPLQTVQVKGSGAADKDVVVPVEYDMFGREAKKYLPYASTTNNGSYKTNGLSEVINYYAGQPSGQAVAFSTPFSEARFEPSPLNRVLEQGGPGSAWQIAANNTGHTLKTEYGANINNEVKLWTVNTLGATASYYAANKLYKTILKDENWLSGKAGTTEEFKDVQGKVVLKRAWETESINLSTYYVYDEQGNLRYVLPPAVNENTDRNGGVPINSFAETDNVFREFIYGYHYDGRKRLTEKKVPGKDWEFMIYNPLDQVILSQDWKQRSESKWLFTKYDAFGNVVITGLYLDGSTRPVLQAAIDALSVSNPNYRWWELSSGSGVGYTNDVFPQSINYYHSINYYGSYNFPGNVFGLPNAGLGQVEEARTKGLLTASSITVLGTGSMLLTVNYYDSEGRVIQSKSQHYKNNTADANNYDEVSNVYTFNDELKESTRKHFNNGTEALYVYNKYQYDHMGRKLSTEQKTGANSATGNPLVKLSGNTYNEIGQLLNKGQGSTAGGSFLQSTDYTYNERGWLKTSVSGLFSMELKYQESGSQYNGNISQQVYNNNYSNTFSYAYDKLNRLTGSSAGNNLGESISYDVMGNIKTLYRDGYGTNDYNISLYTGNQLKQISGFTNGSYTYNDNGNLEIDGPNGNTISYNYLNLPMQVSGSQSVNYLYDASGTKLRKQSASTGVTDYIDGIHYKPNGDIDFVQTEEGIARNNSGVYSYEYNQTDHLGNVRLSFYSNPSSGLLEVLQRDDYYAFGQRKAIGSVGTNKYLYNGKELQEELGQFDYGARFYDPIIGRWNVVDPLAEKFYSVNPYNYTDNNPVNNTDPNGMETYYGQEAQDIFRQSQSQMEQGGGDGPGDPPKQKGRNAVNKPGTIIRKTQKGYSISQVEQGDGGTGLSDAMELGFGFTPIGTAIDFTNLIEGKDRSGNDLSWGWRLGGIIPLVSEFKNSNKVVKAATKVFGKEVAEVAPRIGRDGEAVEVIFKDGSKIDINAARVKEWVPNTHPKAPAGTLQKVKFENSLPGSKGYKREATQAEINYLKNLLK